jgi:hypothetical protein
MGSVDYCFSCTWDLFCFVSFSFHVLLAFIGVYLAFMAIKCKQTDHTLTSTHIKLRSAY